MGYIIAKISDKERKPIFLAFLLCMYYVLPKLISVVAELFFLFLLLIDKTNRLNGKKMRPIIWYLLFTLCLTLTNIFRIDDTTINYLTTCVNNFIFILIACLLFRKKEEIETFVSYFGAFGFFLLIALAPLVAQMLLEGGGTQLGSTSPDSGSTFLQNPINLGYILFLLSLCQFYGMISSNTTIGKFIFVFLLFLTFSCILLAGSRKAIIACFIYSSTYVFFKNKNNIRKIIKYLMISILFILIVYIIIQNVEVLYWSMGKRMEGLLGYFNPEYSDVDPSTEARSNLIKIGIQAFYDYPIFGLGIRETQKILLASHPHNNYLSCLLFGGIFTFFAYYWFYLMIYISYIKSKLKNIMNTLLLGLMIAFLIIDYTATTYNIIYFPFFLTLVYLNLELTKKKNENILA